ncbi:MAG: BrnT family toxin [Terracidiphilus sp.]
MYEWDEAKREANLRKHGFDFDDADIVYENAAKITFEIGGRGGHGGWI